MKGKSLEFCILASWQYFSSQNPLLIPVAVSLNLCQAWLDFIRSKIAWWWWPSTHFNTTYFGCFIFELNFHKRSNRLWNGATQYSLWIRQTFVGELVLECKMHAWWINLQILGFFYNIKETCAYGTSMHLGCDFNADRWMDHCWGLNSKTSFKNHRRVVPKQLWPGFKPKLF